MTHLCHAGRVLRRLIPPGEQIRFQPRIESDRMTVLDGDMLSWSD